MNLLNLLKRAKRRFIPTLSGLSSPTTMATRFKTDLEDQEELLLSKLKTNIDKTAKDIEKRLVKAESALFGKPKTAKTTQQPKRNLLQKLQGGSSLTQRFKPGSAQPTSGGVPSVGKMFLEELPRAYGEALFRPAEFAEKLTGKTINKNVKGVVNEIFNPKITRPFGAEQQITGGKEFLKELGSIALAFPEAFTGKEKSITVPVLGKISGYGAKTISRGDQINKFAEERGIKLPPGVGEGVAAGVTAAEGIMSTLFWGRLVGQGAAALAKKVNVPDEAHVGAWKTLKEPKTLEEGQETWRRLSHDYHPDKIGGDGTVQKEINSAWEILEKRGIPSNATIGKVLQSINAPLGKIPSIFSGSATAGIEEKLQIPMQAGTMPEYAPKVAPGGLSIQEMPAKPIGGEGGALIKPEATIDDIAKGLYRLAAPKSIKADWQMALGKGNYMRIFGGGENAPKPDEVANSLGMTEDEFKNKLVERLQQPKALSPEEEYLRGAQRAGEMTEVAQPRFAKTTEEITSEDVVDNKLNLVAMEVSKALPKKVTDFGYAIKQVAKEKYPELTNNEIKQITEIIAQNTGGGQKPPVVPPKLTTPTPEEPPFGRIPGISEETEVEIIKERALVRGSEERLRFEKKLLNDTVKREAQITARVSKAGERLTRKITRKQMIDLFKSDRAKLQATKKVLTSYIKEHLPESARGKFLQSLQSSLSKRKQVSIFSRVNRVAEKIQRKQLVTELKKPIRINQIDVKYQKRLDDAFGGIDWVNPTPKTLRRLKGLADYLKENKEDINIPTARILRLERLAKTPVGEMTTGQLQQLKLQKDYLMARGKLMRELKYKYNERLRKVALDKLINSTNNMDVREGRFEKWNMVKSSVKKLYMDTLHAFRVADMIDGFKGYRGENAKYAIRFMTGENNALFEAKNIALDTLNQIKAIKPILDKNDQLNLTILLHYEQGAYDQVQQLISHYGLKGLPTKTPEYERIMNVLREAVGRNYDKITPIFEEIENQILGKVNNYWPIKYEKEFNVLPGQAIIQNRYKTTRTARGFTFGRKAKVDKLPRVDVLGVFDEAINEQLWYVNIQPEIENIKYLIKDPEFLKAGGQTVVDFWSEHLDQIARRGWSASARPNPILKLFRLNMNKAYLGYKVSSAIMQPFAVFDGMAYSVSRWGAGVAGRVFKETTKCLLNPKFAKSIIAESKALQLRIGGELALEETLKSMAGKTGPWSKFVRGSLRGIQWGDILTSAGVEKAIYNTLVEEGIPNPREEADFYMNLISGSAEIASRPHILGHGEGARTWFTFQTFFLNRWGIIAHDLVRGGVINGKGLWKKLAGLLGLGILIAGGIAENETRRKVYKLTTGQDIAKTPIAVQAITELPSQIPYFGQMINLAQGSSADPPLMKTIEDTFSGARTVVTAKTPRARYKGAVRAASGVAGVGFGVPGTGQAKELLYRFAPQETTTTGGTTGGATKVPESIFKTNMPTMPKFNKPTLPTPTFPSIYGTTKKKKKPPVGSRSY